MRSTTGRCGMQINACTRAFQAIPSSGCATSTKSTVSIISPKQVTIRLRMMLYEGRGLGTGAEHAKFQSKWEHTYTRMSILPNEEKIGENVVLTGVDSRMW